MKKWIRALTAVAASVVLASCGGGGGGVAGSNSVGFTQMVVFGDSLSDIGTYKVGTIAAVGGGKWTVNSPTAKNWTELIAAQYKLPTPCPAQTGLPSVLFTGFVGAPVTNFPDCRNYAQGSSRVTSLYSPSSLGVQEAVYQAYGGPAGLPAATAAANPTAAQAAASAAGLGLMAVPVVTQMNTHLSNVGGSYTGKELVAVLAGGNDFFMNFNGVVRRLAATGRLWPPSLPAGPPPYRGKCSRAVCPPPMLRPPPQWQGWRRRRLSWSTTSRPWCWPRAPLTLWW